MRASEFIPEGIHKDLAIDPNDPAAEPLYYHTLSSKTINDILHKHYRGQAKINPKSAEGKHIKKIDKILAKFILNKTAKVYTGIPVSVQHAYEKYKADRSKPIRLHLPAYTSTSTSLSQAMIFARESNNILMIELPVGTPAVSVKKISAYDYEKEVLLPRGMEIIVKPTPNVVEKNGKKVYVWQAKALGHSPIQVFQDKV